MFTYIHTYIPTNDAYSDRRPPTGRERVREVVCMSDRERVCVYVCVRVRERENKQINRERIYKLYRDS